MTNHRKSLTESPLIRGVAALGGFLAIVLVLGEVPTREAVPPAIVLTGVIAHNVADEALELPRGSGQSALGVAFLLTGIYLLVATRSTFVATVVVVAGSWFVFDGVTTARYGRSDASNEYRDSNSSQSAETMLRAQTRIVVFRALRKMSEPRTAPELAAELDLTESRVTDALDTLQEAGRVEIVEDGYESSPTRWGPLTPIVAFVVWVPKRIVRPVYRLR